MNTKKNETYYHTLLVPKMMAADEHSFKVELCKQKITHTGDCGIEHQYIIAVIKIRPSQTGQTDKKALYRSLIQSDLQEFEYWLSIGEDEELKQETLFLRKLLQQFEHPEAFEEIDPLLLDLTRKVLGIEFADNEALCLYGTAHF